MRSLYTKVSITNTYTTVNAAVSTSFACPPKIPKRTIIGINNSHFVSQEVFNANLKSNLLISICFTSPEKYDQIDNIMIKNIPGIIPAKKILFIDIPAVTP